MLGKPLQRPGGVAAPGRAWGVMGAQDIFGLPPLTGPQSQADRMVAVQHLQAFFHLEEWYAAGKPPGELNVGALPSEHRILAAVDGPAFEHYRAAMLSYYEQSILQRQPAAIIRSLLRRVLANDPDGLRAFIDAADGGMVRYIQQRSNAYRPLRESYSTATPPYRTLPVSMSGSFRRRHAPGWTTTSATCPSGSSAYWARH